MGNGNGKGKTPREAEIDAANGLAAGQYNVKIVGKVETGSSPQPTPIGDYKATLKKP